MVADEPIGQYVEDTHVVGADTPVAHMDPPGHSEGVVLPDGQKLEAGHVS